MAAEAAREVGLADGCRNPFKSIVVRSIEEALHAYEGAVKKNEMMKRCRVITKIILHLFREKNYHIITSNASDIIYSPPIHFIFYTFILSVDHMSRPWGLITLGPSLIHR